MPDAGGLVIASDQDSARAYAEDAQGGLRRVADGRAVRREAGVEEDRRLRRPATTAGWSRSGWSPRASTCPGWRSASTPRRRRPRCSSPRRSAASCGPGAAARPRRCSCRRCRTCWPTPPSWRWPATTSSAGGSPTRPTSSPPRTTCWPGPRRASRVGRPRGRLPFEALGSQAHFDRVLFDGAEFGHEGEVHVGSDEEMDFLGIPGLLEPDQMRELLAQRQSDRRKKQPARARPRRAGADHPRAARRAAPRAQRPGRRLAPPHRPGRTASPTPRCARSAAARPPRSPAPRCCASGSTGCASGRRAPAAPDRRHAAARPLQSSPTGSRAGPRRPRRRRGQVEVRGRRRSCDARYSS